MLSNIGAKIRTFLVTILVGLLVVAFAVWGVNDMFSPSANDAVIQVGKTKIERAEFVENFERELRAFNEQAQSSGQNAISNEEAFNRGLHRRVLDALTTSAVLRKDAEDLGVEVNRRNVRDFLAEIPAFQDPITEQFSEDALNNYLAQARRSRESFENQVLHSLRSDQIVPAIVRGVEAPSIFADRLNNFISEQRRATVLTLTEDAIDPIADPGDEALQAYIDANSVPYMAPEYRKFIMIRLEPSDYRQTFEITEDELKAAFDYKIEAKAIGEEETRSVVLITADSEEKASQAATRMAAGEPPVTVAESLELLSPDTFVDVTQDGLIDPETSTAAFELANGEAKAVLGSFGNWIAVYVSGVKEAVIPDFDAMKEELRTELIKDKALDEIYAQTDEIETRMTEGQTLEEIAEGLDISLQAFDFIDRSGVTQDGLKMAGFSLIPGVASDETLLRTIFTSDLGFDTDLFETETGGFATLRVDDIIDSKMRPLAEVRERALASWQTEQIEDALLDKAAGLLGEARGGESLEDLAEATKGATVREIGISRANPPRDISPQVILAMLEGSKGDLARGAGSTPKTYDIGRLDAIIPNSDILAGQILDVIQDRATQELTGDIENAYQAAILSENELRRNEAQVRRALGINDPS